MPPLHLGTGGVEETGKVLESLDYVTFQALDQDGTIAGSLGKLRYQQT